METVLMHRTVCLFTTQFSLVLVAHTPRRDGQAELTWMAGYIARWFTRPQTDTHPSTNRVLSTSLMRPTTLPT